MKRIILGLLLLAATWPCAADDAATPEQVVGQFFAAYGDGDSARALGLLTPDVDPLVRSEVRNDLYVRCIEVRSLVIRPGSRDAAKAAVETTAQLVRRSRKARWTSDEVERRTFRLVKAGETWRIEAMPLAEEALIDSLVKAATREESDALLAAHPDLVTPALVRQLVARAITIGRAGAGRPDQRLADLARDVAAAAGNRAALAMAMGTQVSARMELPDVDARDLLPLAEESLRIAREEDDPRAISYTANTLALLHLTIDAASAEAERVLRWLLTQRDRLLPYHVAAVFANIGECLSARGDYAAAYQAFTEALSFDLAQGLEQDVAHVEVSIGRILQVQNDPELALDFFRRGTQRKAARFILATGWLGIAEADRALGRHDDARAAAGKALELARDTPFRYLVARALVARAAVEIDRGETGAAEKTLQEAIAAAREKDEIDAEMEAQLVLGNLHVRQRRFAEARRVADQVLELAGRSDFPRPERYAALMLAARVEAALGNRDDALAAYRSAIDAIEVARGAVAGSERQQRLFFEPYHAAYTESAGLLLEKGDVEEALFQAERGKGRVLLDAMGRERERAESALSKADREKLAALVAALGEANKQVVLLRASDTTAGALAEGTARQRRAQLALDAVESDFAARDPRLRAARGGAAVIDAAGLEEVVARPDVAILEFVVRQNATELLVVRRDGARVVVTHHRIDVGQDALAARVDDFRDGLAGGSLRYKPAARALYDLLLAPAAAEIAGKRVLCLVPDGVLWRVPFEALLAPDGRFVIERAACFYAPSISVYRSLVARRRETAGTVAERSLVAFGNPSIEGTRERIHAVYRSVELAPLPDAEREAKAIARLWGAGAAVYVGREASEEAAKAEMQRARIVHFAAHGVFDDANPMFSHIVLAHGARSAEDGALQAWELMRLDLKTDLVVLSACETARGRFGAGEGLIGMSWALFAAGCRSTVATQWKVSSRYAAPLMIAFHRHLAHGAGSPFAKAEALRAAQRSMLRHPATRHPFYWAAFVLLGDPS